MGELDYSYIPEGTPPLLHSLTYHEHGITTTVDELSKRRMRYEEQLLPVHVEPGNSQIEGPYIEGMDL